jgi:K+-transporting ATPase A subunit
VPPWLVFLIVLALTLAFAYQLASRRFGWRIVGYSIVIFAVLLGFEALAEAAGINATRLGDLRLGPDLAGATVALFALWFLGV